MTRTPTTISASIAFDSGLVLATRCQNGVFDVILGGLSTSTSDSRTIKVKIGDSAETTEPLVLGTGGAALSGAPTPLARRLRNGGTLELTEVGSDGVDGRHWRVDAPKSEAAVDQTLAACNRPRVDPRLERYPGASFATGLTGDNWDIRLAAEYPTAAANAGVTSGRVVMSCVVVEQGRVDDCLTESESPAGLGFADATLRGLRRARIRMGSYPFNTIITFTTRYAVQ